jgi:hypothetical protein
LVLVLQNHHFVGAYPATRTYVVTVGDNYIPSNFIYGHLCMARMAGTEFNGRLASPFEQVCGNKGYSYYDAYQYIELAANSGEMLMKKIADYKSNNLIAKQFKKCNGKKSP